MGTRADFYVGRGSDAEWLGSIAWDGYPEGLPGAVLDAGSEERWREGVGAFVRERTDGTEPGMGWPWPWEDSRWTDFAYAWDGGAVWVAFFGRGWVPMPGAEEIIDWSGYDKQSFPDMTEVAATVVGGSRSGVILLGVGGEGPVIIESEEEAEGDSAV